LVLLAKKRGEDAMIVPSRAPRTPVSAKCFRKHHAGCGGRRVDPRLYGGSLIPCNCPCHFFRVRL